MTRRLILESDRRLLFPRKGLEEVEKYRVELCRRTGLAQKSFVRLLERLLACMERVKDETFETHLKNADELVKDIDPDDAAFIACCLAFPGSVLWSDDKALQQQDAIRIVTTEELRAEFSSAA